MTTDHSDIHLDEDLIGLIEDLGLMYILGDLCLFCKGVFYTNIIYGLFMNTFMGQTMYGNGGSISMLMISVTKGLKI